jgi:ubiquinone biosynthesis protein
MEANLGPGGRLRDAGAGAGALGRMLADLPELVAEARGTVASLAEMTRTGVRLDEATVKQLARQQARHDRLTRVAIWLAAASLAVLAALQVFEALAPIV